MKRKLLYLLSITLFLFVGCASTKVPVKSERYTVKFNPYIFTCGKIWQQIYGYAWDYDETWDKYFEQFSNNKTLKSDLEYFSKLENPLIIFSIAVAGTKPEYGTSFILPPEQTETWERIKRFHRITKINEFLKTHSEYRDDLLKNFNYSQFDYALDCCENYMGEKLPKFKLILSLYSYISMCDGDVYLSSCEDPAIFSKEIHEICHNYYVRHSDDFYTSVFNKYGNSYPMDKYGEIVTCIYAYNILKLNNSSEVDINDQFNYVNSFGDFSEELILKYGNEF